MTHRQRFFRALTATAATAAVAALGLAGTAQAAPAVVHHARAHHLVTPALKGVNIKPIASKPGKPAILVPYRHRIKGSGGGNLLYNGGPVQASPQVFLLFWGSWWNSSCSNTQGNGSDAESYLYGFTHGMGGPTDHQTPVDAQYNDSAGDYPTSPVPSNQVFASWNADCTDPPASATDAQLASEAAGYASYLQGQGFTIGNSTQIVVVSPSGTNPGGGFGSQYCAYHNVTSFGSGSLSWTNLPYMPDAGSNCGANFVQGPDDGWSIVEGHEFNESVTDPFINAWIDNQGFETGDKCAWQGLYAQTMSTGSFAMQPEWDNHTSACQPAATYTWGRIYQTARGFNGECVDDSGGTLANGTKVDIAACTGFQRQRWMAFPNTSLGRYQDTGYCANIVNHSTVNGALIDLLRCDGDWNQQWVYNPGSHQWVNPHTGKCLRDPNNTTTAGTQLQLWSCVASYASEQWSNV
jgi:hypothetical protein